MSKLIVIRGLPGSGKSTLAPKLAFSENCYEADSYFIRPDGIYDFNIRLISEAHDWCKAVVFRGLTNWRRCAVSNTFTQWWELKPYIEFCKENGHEVEVITLTTQFESIHGIPDEAFKRMSDRFESHESIMLKVNEVMG